MSRLSFHYRRQAEQAFGYAQAVSAGGLLFVSGTLAVDAAFEPLAVGDMRGQLYAVYAALGETLQAHGLGFASVVKETAFVTDMDAFLGANDVRLGVYEGLPLPAATVVEVRRLAFPDNLVEIELVAVLGAREAVAQDPS